MERKNFADLIEVLKKTNYDTSENFELFARAFFETIADGLAEQKFVKIKGIGTFKVIEVSPRDSVDVSTGNRIKIEKHSKITFTPDAYLRDMINKPFAHLQSVVINEGTDIGQMTNSDNTIIEEIHKESHKEEVNSVPLTVKPENTECCDNTTIEEENVAPQIASDLKESCEDEITEHESTNEPPEITNRTNKSFSTKKMVFLIAFTAVIFFVSGFYLGINKDFVEIKPKHKLSENKETRQNIVKVSRKQTTIITPKIKRENDTVKKKEKVHPVMPVVAGDKYMIVGEQEPHTLKQGENITRIAKQTYGSKEFAKYIIRFNKISNPDIVPVGTMLKMPKLVPNDAYLAE